jgi:hypothetical protein
MAGSSSHRALARVFAVGITVTISAAVVCAEAGPALICASATCSPALTGSGSGTASVAASRCAETAFAQPAALQSADGDAAPAPSVSQLGPAGGRGADPDHLSSEPTHHTFKDGTAVYLVVSSFLL